VVASCGMVVVLDAVFVIRGATGDSAIIIMQPTVDSDIYSSGDSRSREVGSQMAARNAVTLEQAVTSGGVVGMLSGTVWQARH
jgi:hypothetical protein